MPEKYVVTGTKTNRDKSYYEGRREFGKPVVERHDGIRLDPAPSLKLRNHSPDGFEWGYPGSGPAQLALAVLLDFTADEALAERLYQTFKFDLIATAPHDGFRLWGFQIRNWLEAQSRARV